MTTLIRFFFIFFNLQNLILVDIFKNVTIYFNELVAMHYGITFSLKEAILLPFRTDFASELRIYVFNCCLHWQLTQFWSLYLSVDTLTLTLPVAALLTVRS